MYRDPALNSAAFIQQSRSQCAVGGDPFSCVVQEMDATAQRQRPVSAAAGSTQSMPAKKSSECSKCARDAVIVHVQMGDQTQRRQIANADADAGLAQVGIECA